MALRWILRSRASMQRIGILYFVCKHASKGRAITREALAKKVFDELKAIEPVPTERRESMSRYIDRLKTSGTKNWYTRVKIPENSAQYQDLLLDDDLLPSSTGRVMDEVAVDFVDEAVEWGLLRNVNFTITDRGVTLRTLWESGSGSNPLLLTPLLRHACTFWYLDADGDALRTIYSKLPVDPATVNREEIGKTIPLAITELLESDVKAKSLGRTERQRLLSLRKAIVDAKGESTGSGRAIYQQATMRGEHPADLGLVNKPDRFRYQYRIPGNSLLSQLDVDMGRFLEHKFAAAYSGWLYGSSRLSEDADVWPYFQEAYLTLKNPLGYASYNDVALLTQVIAAKSGTWMEIATIKDRVNDPTGRFRTRIGLGRNGKPEYVKVELG